MISGTTPFNIFESTTRMVQVVMLGYENTIWQLYKPGRINQKCWILWNFFFFSCKLQMCHKESDSIHANSDLLRSGTLKKSDFTSPITALVDFSCPKICFLVLQFCTTIDIIVDAPWDKKYVYTSTYFIWNTVEKKWK